MTRDRWYGDSPTWRDVPLRPYRAPTLQWRWEGLGFLAVHSVGYGLPEWPSWSYWLVPVSIADQNLITTQERL